MASPQPQTRKRKIHFLSDLSDAEEENLAPPQQRCKREPNPKYNHAQNTPMKPGLLAPPTVDSQSRISQGHATPATEPIATPTECLTPDGSRYIDQLPLLPSFYTHRSQHLPPDPAVDPITTPTECLTPDGSRYIPAIIPSLHTQRSQHLPPDPAAEPIFPDGADTGPCIITYENQPTQERSPPPTKPEPSPHGSRPPSASETSPRTPFEFVYTNAIDHDFGQKVCDAYQNSRWREMWRINMYGESVASEWKNGSTPEEAREAFKAMLEEQERDWNDLTPSDEGERIEWRAKRQQEPVGRPVTEPDIPVTSPPVIAPESNLK
ncbi:MAG: hypothetical protein Q9216_002434 [Gyalolechia sp. 2 TL-2023]